MGPSSRMYSTSPDRMKSAGRYQTLFRLEQRASGSRSQCTVCLLSALQCCDCALLRKTQHTEHQNPTSKVAQHAIHRRAAAPVAMPTPSATHLPTHHALGAGCHHHTRIFYPRRECCRDKSPTLEYGGAHLQGSRCPSVQQCNGATRWPKGGDAARGPASNATPSTSYCMLPG
jgi:hypothetical protein